MYVLTSSNELVNLDTAGSIEMTCGSGYGLSAWYPYNIHFVLVDGCKSEDIARKHLANIADALSIGKNVYVIGTDPLDDNNPSEYVALNR